MRTPFYEKKVPAGYSMDQIARISVLHKLLLLRSMGVVIIYSTV